MTFLNNNSNNATTTVLPDFQYLTSPSGEQPGLTTTTTTPSSINHIPTCPIPKSVDCNQYGSNITNSNNHHHQHQHHHTNTTHVSKSEEKGSEVAPRSCLQMKRQPSLNSFPTQQPTTNIGRIMTGKTDRSIGNEVVWRFSILSVGPDMSVSAIDISALASQLTSNFLASLTNAAVVTNHSNSGGNLPIKSVLIHGHLSSEEISLHLVSSIVNVKRRTWVRLKQSC